MNGSNREDGFSRIHNYHLNDSISNTPNVLFFLKCKATFLFCC